ISLADDQVFWQHVGQLQDRLGAQDFAATPYVTALHDHPKRFESIVWDVASTLLQDGCCSPKPYSRDRSAPSRSIVETLSYELRCANTPPCHGSERCGPGCARTPVGYVQSRSLPVQPRATRPRRAVPPRKA